MSRTKRCKCPECDCNSPTSSATSVCGFCRTGLHNEKVLCLHADRRPVDITELHHYLAHECSDRVGYEHSIVARA